MAGVARTVKAAGLVAVPPGVETRTGPVETLTGAVADMRVGEITLKTALKPLKVTAVAPVNALPVSSTTVPAAPVVGLRLVIAGAAITLKTAALCAGPFAVAILMGPLAAPTGTVAVIFTVELTVKTSVATPPNDTAVTFAKLAPLIVTVLPGGPLVGVKPLITGPVVTENVPAL